MKKRVFITGLLLGALAVNAFADETVQKNTKNLNGIANFYYKQGYQTGYKQGYEAGYAKAIRYAENKLNEYALKIKAYEAGKYLIKSQRITYPQVFYIKNPLDNSIKIVIKNSQISNEIGASDILYIPELNLKDFNNINNSVNPNSSKYHTVSNAVSLNEEQTNPEIPKLSKNTLNTYYIYMPNTQSYKDILNQAGLVYAETGNRLKIIFTSKQNAKKFIKNFGLVKNVDYFTSN